MPNRSLIRSVLVPPPALSFMAVLLLVTLASATQISVSPTVPTVDDSVSLTAFGWWGNSCAPAYHSHSVGDRWITLVAVANPDCGPCMTVMTRWEFTVEVGQLVSGAYTVWLYVVECHGPPVLLATERFTVFDDPSKMYLPTILSYAKVE